MAVAAGTPEARRLDVTLEPEGYRSEVTVTASRGLVQDTSSVTQPVNVIDAREIGERAKMIVGQVATEEPGVQLLRTAPVMAGIYVRGLTGNKVNVFVDGVRYSTASARGGVNTFLDLIEPSTLDSAEILRGPTAAQYGSDALGGSVQFLTGVPAFTSPGGRALHGGVTVRATSGDRSAVANANLGYSGGNFGLFINGAMRSAGSVRPGKGIDSHAAVTRFFGLVSTDLMDSRLPDTAWSQLSGLVKFSWAPGANNQLVFSYARSQQTGAKRYDQLLGGDGNLIADLRDLTLDLGYVKYNRVGFGPFDLLTATYSFNAQREERVNQGGNGNPKALVTHEPEKTTVHGFQAHATKQWGTRHSLVVGGEYYPEQVWAPSYSEDPTTGATAVRRGRVPDGARYRSGGAYVQDTVDIVSNRLQIRRQPAVQRRFICLEGVRQPARRTISRCGPTTRRPPRRWRSARARSRRRPSGGACRPRSAGGSVRRTSPTSAPWASRDPATRCRPRRSKAWGPPSGRRRTRRLGPPGFPSSRCNPRRASPTRRGCTTGTRGSALTCPCS